MNIIPSNEIVATLSAFADSAIPYRLLRNIGDEMPDNLKTGKDIDILVRWDDIQRIELFLKQIGFKRVLHPLRRNQYLYGVHPFRFYKHNQLNYFIDCHFELACRSLNKGEWIPLDRSIQEHAWSDSALHHIGGVAVTGLPHACECIFLLARSIFDKRKFDARYIRRIEELAELLNDSELLEIMQPVFYRFSTALLKMLRAKRYEQIVLSHLQFMDY